MREFPKALAAMRSSATRHTTQIPVWRPALCEWPTYPPGAVMCVLHCSGIVRINPPNYYDMGAGSLLYILYSDAV